MHKTIYIPYKIYVNKCEECNVEYSITATTDTIDLDSANYWSNQVSTYCPYCGKKTK